MSLMMFPPKLLQWLSADIHRTIQISAFMGGGWFATLHMLGKEEPVAEGTGKLPGEAVIKCWENYLTISN